jgi:hypothetical protein
MGFTNETVRVEPGTAPSVVLSLELQLIAQLNEDLKSGLSSLNFKGDDSTVSA